MITIYAPDAVDFSTLGEGALCPSECVIEEQALGQYSLTMTHPMDAGGKWRMIAPGCVLKAPAPVRETPLAVEDGEGDHTVEPETVDAAYLPRTDQHRGQPASAAGAVYLHAHPLQIPPRHGGRGTFAVRGLGAGHRALVGRRGLHVHGIPRLGAGRSGDHRGRRAFAAAGGVPGAVAHAAFSHCLRGAGRPQRGRCASRRSTSSTICSATSSAVSTRRRTSPRLRW